MRANAPTNPMIGEPTSGTSTLLTRASTLIAPVPTPINVAPSSPPMRAWLLELGMPNRHVMRFQVMAPTSAEAITIWPAWPSGTATIPEPIVAATAVPVSAPTKLALAERAIPRRGERARVETDVAIAFAVSWKPLM